MRKEVDGSMDYFVLHPNDMADLLENDKFIDSDFISTIRQIDPQTTVCETNLGITFFEVEAATDNNPLGIASRRAGRFTIKTEPRTQRFDLGDTGGALQKGVTVWEMIDAVLERDTAVCEMDTG